jgi:anhydro-N-acetylmuramic acid kinase
MQKVGPVWALGSMSGTSLDGVDAAMVLTDGDRVYEFGPDAFRPYSDAERKTIAAAFGRWHGDDGIDEVAEIVETAHLEVLSRFTGADIIGFHGQTLAHDPRGRGTHQCGNGSVLANVLGLPVVWDFRSADVAMGGQGAPLAPFFHHACAVYLGQRRPLAILNLGGVGNLTWIDPSLPNPDMTGAILAFDTGPANAPINDFLLKYFDLAFDADGQMAATGQIDLAFIDAFLSLPYFYKQAPKSLDRNDFAAAFAALAKHAPRDAIATLTDLAAACVQKGSEQFPQSVSTLLVSGGGRHNTTLMQQLAARLPGTSVQNIDAVGLNGDMLEAQAFGYLAVRVQRGKTTSAPGSTGVVAALGGGQISLPSALL